MDTRTIEELKKLAEAKPVAWSRSDRFVNHYREMTDRPENATSDVNEWKALYSEETVAALIERVERAEAALKLAEGRLALLLRVFPEEREDCDHPTATRSVLASVTEALWRSS